MDNINRILLETGGALLGLLSIVGTVLQLLGQLQQVLEKLNQFWIRVHPALKKPLVFIAQEIIPNGIIIWIWYYVAAVNARRLAEPQVFLLLVAYTTLSIVSYNIFWRRWIYPKLIILLRDNRGNNQVAGGTLPNVKDH